MSRAAAKAASMPGSPVGSSGKRSRGCRRCERNVRARSSHGLAYSSTRPKPLVTGHLALRAL
jgi:hypothetical protein